MPTGVVMAEDVHCLLHAVLRVPHAALSQRRPLGGTGEDACHVVHLPFDKLLSLKLAVLHAVHGVVAIALLP